MKHAHHNLGGLTSLPFIAALLGAGVLLVALKPVLAQQFTEVFPGLPASAQPRVAWGDYDGDGDLNVLVAGSASHDIAFATRRRRSFCKIPPSVSTPSLSKSVSNRSLDSSARSK